MNKLSYKQLKWLSEHGDRNIHDVQEDETGLFVMMGSGKESKYYRHYLPIPVNKSVNKVLKS